MNNTPYKQLTKQKIINAESGCVINKGVDKTTIALVYPNTYYVGMSNLGFHTLYHLFHKTQNTICERVFTDFQDQKDLRTFETNRPVSHCDMLAFSISFENDYLNILNLLNKANIPFLAKDRKDNDPIVIAGGTAITINPEPVRAFFDILFIGEAEEAILDIVTVLKTNEPKQVKLEHLKKIPGCYLSKDIQNLNNMSHFISSSDPYPGTLNLAVSGNQLKQYKKTVLKDLNKYPTHTIIHTPYTEFADVALIEVQKGCEYGCRFCAECFVAAPFRERSITCIKKQIDDALTVKNKIGLIGTNLLKYPGFLELANYIHNNKATFSPSSVRADDLNANIIKALIKSHHKTISLAPEAGSDKLRASLNKKITNNDLLNKIELLGTYSINRIKLYLMVGLPGEAHKDIDELILFVKQAHKLIKKQAKKTKQMPTLILSINSFIPKPKTPFANKEFESIKELKQKINQIKKTLMPLGSITINVESVFLSYIQALLANGNYQTHQFIFNAFKENNNLKKALKLNL